MSKDDINPKTEEGELDGGLLNGMDTEAIHQELERLERQIKEQERLELLQRSKDI